MEQTFLTGIKINKVRHLENILIPLDTEKRKHLILTGKNGSGKTSVLEALAEHFEYAVSRNYEPVEELAKWDSGAVTECTSFMVLRKKYQEGKFLIAYYKADRLFQAEKYVNIEKVELERKYGITETPGEKFAKYLVDLKATRAFSKDKEKCARIDEWFDRFEAVLKKIFHDEELKLIFDEETFQFSIRETGREPFGFNTMSSGYAAVLDIINDLIIRMEAVMRLRTFFDMEGIVLIDEIETHLHMELQKEILPVLTELFPNLQFLITTHSPFVLSSLENAVIYDLENKKLVRNGLANLPYEGIVEGYFHVDRLSEELRKKFERYKELVSKKKLVGAEYEEIAELEYYLDEIPDYLAAEITAEYSRLKLEFENRR